MISHCESTHACHSSEKLTQKINILILDHSINLVIVIHWIISDHLSNDLIYSHKMIN